MINKNQHEVYKCNPNHIIVLWSNKSSVTLTHQPCARPTRKFTVSPKKKYITKLIILDLIVSSFIFIYYTYDKII